MQNNLNRRVARLEGKGHGKKRFLVVRKDRGESNESAIKRAEVGPVNDDTILIITQISRDPGDSPIEGP